MSQMNPSNYLLLKGGVNALQGGTKGLTSSDKKKSKLHDTTSATTIMH